MSNKGEPNGPVRSSKIDVGRLEQVDPSLLLAHFRDPRIGRHLPLLTDDWDLERIAGFVAAKAAYWDRDGLGHWAFWIDDAYAGWGGFQKEGDDWDFGLVLVPDHYSRGREIADFAFRWLVRETDIREVTFLLPETRSPRALTRLGARATGDVVHDGTRFTRWALTLPEPG